MEAAVRGEESKPLTSKDFAMFLSGYSDDSRIIRSLQRNKEEKPREPEKDLLQRAIDALPKGLRDYWNEKMIEDKLKEGTEEWKVYQEKKKKELLRKQEERAKVVAGWKAEHKEKEKRRKEDFLEKKRKGVPRPTV